MMKMMFGSTLFRKLLLSFAAILIYFSLGAQTASAQGSCSIIHIGSCSIADACQDGYSPEVDVDCFTCSCQPEDLGSIGVSCPVGQTYIGIFDECLSFGQAVSWGIQGALVIGTMLAAIRLAIAILGITFSSGDSGKLEEARESMQDAILGIVLMAAAWLLLTYFNQTLPPEWRINLFMTVT